MSEAKILIQRAGMRAAAKARKKIKAKTGEKRLRKEVEMPSKTRFYANIAHKKRRIKAGLVRRCANPIAKVHRHKSILICEDSEKATSQGNRYDYGDLKVISMICSTGDITATLTTFY